MKMDRELEEIVNRFLRELEAYEKGHELFCELWRSKGANEGLRVEIKKYFPVHLINF
jgi:hypothetical protein